MSADGVSVVTFGCRLNIVESDAMRARALASGHTDLTIVNTCAVTAEASRQARQAIRRLHREAPSRQIIVTGCASEVDPQSYAALAGVVRLLPNATKADPASWGDAAGQPSHAKARLHQDASGEHTRGFVEIQNGCDHRCTFCVIPFGRGASRSIPTDQVIATIRTLVETGTRDVVLTGVDITSYADGTQGLGALVKFILRAIPDLPRLRLSSLDCIEADAALLDAFANEPRLMPHLHLSLQAGSDLILKRMKRRHSRADAIALCDTLRRLRPDVVFGADFIAGFPTETEEQFAETLDLLGACKLTHVHVFPFSPRPGTPAARMPAVAGDVVKERARQLRLRAEKRLAIHLDRQTGRALRVLTERGGKGRTEDFTAVRLDGNTPHGAFRTIRITGHDGKACFGDIV